MNTALVASIISTVKDLSKLDTAFDKRSSAIRRYIGTIWDLIVPDRTKCSDDWYPNLHRHAEDMVLAFDHCIDAQQLAAQAERRLASLFSIESTDALLAQLELRDQQAFEAAQRSERAFSRLLHEILDCGGDASKVEQATAST